VASQDSDSVTAAVWTALIRRAGEALRHLMEAYRYSHPPEQDSWQFGIEITHLLDAGLTASDLRWLVREAYAAHAVEITRPRHLRRSFRVADNLALTPRSCFLLTAAGFSAVGEWLQASTDGSVPERKPPPALAEGQASEAPRWERHLHTLFWRGQEVAHFRREAPSQEAVLDAFQARRWARCVEVTLACAGACPKAGLHNAVKNLNRKVKPYLQFGQEGNGSRVSWQPLTDGPRSGPSATPLQPQCDPKGTS